MKRSCQNCRHFVRDSKPTAAYPKAHCDAHFVISDGVGRGKWYLQLPGNESVTDNESCDLFDERKVCETCGQVLP
jgi:hypothetical protein